MFSCQSCNKCHDLVNSRTQIVYPSIVPKSKLLVIGEAPGRDEDIAGIGFVGMAGKTLTKLLTKHSILADEYSISNICRCRPPDNRRPTLGEIYNCLPYLAELIMELQPQIILTVGATPTKVFCGRGNLYDQIQRQNHSAQICLKDAHELLRPVLHHVQYIIPTPHTSPLAFNRNAPSGEKWSIIAEKQFFKLGQILKANEER